VFDPPANEDQARLPIRAFLFLSESGNPVMMPGLTWEEIERLLDQESGRDADRQSFSYQSLEIKGSAEQARAELEVVLRLMIEPTGGRWVSIPLRMGNFHRLGPPDVSGVDEYFMTLAADDSGYLLFVRADARHEAMLRMRVSARVDASSVARSLAFRLPDVPARVELMTDADNVSGEVIGRGDEAITTEAMAGRQTRLAVESGGGSFLLRWGKLAGTTDNMPLLEVASRVDVRWDSPQDQPIASVQLTIKNLRGSLDRFQLRLPSGSVVLEAPRLGANGQTIELGAVSKDGVGEVRDVILPEDERQPRIDLNFELQLANDNASSTSPLAFHVPEVIGALRHRGEIEIQTSGDHRLRWRARTWVRSELGESRSDGSSGRTYRFRYDRASFDLPELPLWLAEKERQLRLVSESQLTVLESNASLEMTIQVNGQTSDRRLHFDDQSWRISSIEDAETGEALDSYQAESYRVIEFGASAGDEPAPIRIRAEQPLDPAQREVRLFLPRVIEIDDSTLVQSATVNVVNSGRKVLVVDLEASQGLSRVPPAVGQDALAAQLSSFRVLSQDASALLVGTMIDQPPRIDLASQATIELDGDQLRTTVDWAVSSKLDLQGRLPIRIPRLQSADATRAVAGADAAPAPTLDAASPAQAAESVAVMARPVASQWVVTVDEIPATLEVGTVDDEHYTLISPRLAVGPMQIRWRHVQQWNSAITDGSLDSVSLPLPNFADVTVRGAMPVVLRGNQQLNLVAVDSPASTGLEFETLPRDPIRLKLQSRMTRREELSISQMVLRTAVGRNMRHEQLLATIQGGEVFRVGLPATAGEISVDAYLDEDQVTVQRDAESLVVSLPGDNASHVIDLHVWIPVVTPASLAVIEPMLELPIGAGRVFWQIVTPADGHVVWAAPTLGRSMSWRFDRWKLYREPSHGDQALTAMAGATANLLPPGNRYLYVGSDLRSFQAIVASRAVLWICIGSLVLLTAVILTHFPQARHPLSVVVVAILFGGLLSIAPDAAVLAGQLGIIALVLVIVMLAVRVLITPSRSDRVFATPSGASVRKQPSTQALQRLEVVEPPAVTTTQALPATSASEVAT
jgi:hypothetical protein